MLCKYNKIFGEVNTGIHSIRLYNIAIIDVLLTIIASYIIHLFVRRYNYITILLFLFICGIILHRIFCVRTTVDKFLFP